MKSTQANWALALAMASLLVFSTTSSRAADYYVDPSYAGANGAAYLGYTGAYNSISAALGGSGVPSGSSATTPNRIYVAPGTYITGTTSLSNSRNNIALIGLSGNPNDVVITSYLDGGYNPGSGALGTTGSSSLQLKGNNTSAANITFANSTNTPYIVNIGHKAVTPTGDYTTGNAQTTNQPAVALLLQGDEQAFLNCKFLGYQDTLYTKGGRSYFKDCYVSGDIDFIFANGTTVFDHSTINLDGDHSGGTITAASTDKRTSNGIVFLNSTITGNSVKNDPVIDPQGAANASGPAANNMSLGRPWGWQQVGGDASTVFINTKMTPAIRNAGWLAWNGNETNAANGKQDGNPAKDSRYAEYNSMDLGGSPLDVSSRVAWSKQLTASEAAAYTVANLFSYEPQYPWYGQGYAGSNDPNNPNFSWPAFWGDRNSNNDTANATVFATYPLPGNPTGYTNPSWLVPGAWNPNIQLAAALVPEPGTIVILGTGVLAIAFPRRRRRLSVATSSGESDRAGRSAFTAKQKLCAAVALVSLLVASSVQAASIWNVDLVGANAMSGPAVVGSAGDFWNTAEVANAGSNLTIKDSTGVSGVHNITLNFVATGNLFGFNADGTANPAALMDGFGTSVNNGSGTSAAPLSFTFSDLVPSTAYTVYAYGASTTGTDRGTNFFAAINSPVLGATSGASTDINTGVGVAYTTFSMTTNGSGTFTILTNFHSATSAQAPVNGFQIVGTAPVPEPASIGLVVVSSLLLAASRRRWV